MTPYQADSKRQDKWLNSTGFRVNVNIVPAEVNKKEKSRTEHALFKRKKKKPTCREQFRNFLKTHNTRGHWGRDNAAMLPEGTPPCPHQLFFPATRLLRCFHMSQNHPPVCTLGDFSDRHSGCFWFEPVNTTQQGAPRASPLCGHIPISSQWVMPRSGWDRWVVT